MGQPDPTWTDAATVGLVAGQLLLLVVAALFARRQLNEAKRLREEQIRPFVVVDLESDAPPLFHLAVKNIGTTMARDVKIAFDPPAESTIEHASLDRLKMFRGGISTLPPHKEIRTLFENAITRYKADLPDVYEVRVTYTDQERRKRFEETMDVDFGIYWDRLSVTRHDLHDVHKELELMRKELAKWTANFGGGLLAVSPRDVDERVERFEREVEERRRREAERAVEESPPEPGDEPDRSAGGDVGRPSRPDEQ